LIPKKKKLSEIKKTGLCIECGFDEPGELVGLITKFAFSPNGQFNGYLGNEKATQKKIEKNVFKEGDEYFKTGDLLKMDNEGFLYFVDRIGDTYRWKGQNVATTEISKVIGKFKGIGEANCYGVPVPGHDGKCGMVAILRSEEELNFKDLYSYSINNLTNYQVPCFLRIQTQFNNTGTFKYKKTDLVKDGFDISKNKG